MNKFTKRILVTALLAGSLATTAQAETASDTIDVFAGLKSIMKLTCTDVNFGVWRVPTGVRTGGATTITLDASNQATRTAGSADKVALSTVFEAPRTGVCNVTGSTLTSGLGAVTLNGAATATGSFITNGGTGFNSEVLAAPGTPVESFTYTLNLSSSTPTISGTGTATFTIQGTMSIPDALSAANYGGYKSTTVVAAFEDNAGA